MDDLRHGRDFSVTVTATAKRRRKQARLKNGRKLTKSELIDRMIAMRSGKKGKK